VLSCLSTPDVLDTRLEWVPRTAKNQVETKQSHTVLPRSLGFISLSTGRRALMELGGDGFKRDFASIYSINNKPKQIKRNCTFKDPNQANKRFSPSFLNPQSLSSLLLQLDLNLTIRFLLSDTPENSLHPQTQSMIQRLSRRTSRHFLRRYQLAERDEFLLGRSRSGERRRDTKDVLVEF